MAKRTCAACDCELDETALRITIGGRAVEVCCEACAEKLREAHLAAAAPRRAGGRDAGA
jgi:hypothetical protein